MNDNPDDIEMASMATVSPTGALREPLVLAHADLEAQHAAEDANTQAQAPLLAQPQNPHPLPVNVHATAYMNSTALERKFDDLTQVIKKKSNGGIDGWIACSGSLCVGAVLYFMLGKIQPSCNCNCPAPAHVVCPSLTPPTPLTMDNRTMYNSTQANMTTNANRTTPISTSGFMDMFSTLANTTSDNDTMPTTVPAKLKRD